MIAAPRTSDGGMLALSIAEKAANLSGKRVLSLSFSMSRDAAERERAHRAAEEAVKAELDKGNDTAMLTIGDISVYSTFQYLAEPLKAQGYEVRMIAGVPSFCAAAARLNRSLTEMNSPILIVPAGDKTALEASLDFPGTKVLMKSGRQLPKVLRTLSERGLSECSALVNRCGLEGEEVIDGLGGLDPEKSAGYFATIIVKP